jgi:hypothetical protein
MKARDSLVLACLGLLLPGPAAAERRDHEAHVHGAAEMDVAALDGEVEISLRSPAMNIVGFEHEPRTGQQEQLLRESLEALRDGNTLFSFGDAACRLVDAEVTRTGLDDGHGHDEDEHEHGDDHGHDEDEHGHDEDDHDHGHDEDDHGHDESGRDHEEGAHSGIRSHYHFACEGRVARIDTRLFERFPRTESIRVQYLTDDTQGAQTLTPEAPGLRLE